MGTNNCWSIFQAIWVKDQKSRGKDTSILGVFLGLLGSQAAWGSTLGAVAGVDPSDLPLCFCSSWRHHPSTNTRHQALSSASRYNLSGQCHISCGLVAVPCSCSGTHIPVVSPQPLPQCCIHSWVSSHPGSSCLVSQNLTVNAEVDMLDIDQGGGFLCLGIILLVLQWVCQNTGNSAWRQKHQKLCARGLLSGLAPGVLAHDLLKASTLSAKRGEKHSFRSAYM